MITWRRPFPPAAHRTVVETMQAEQVLPHHEVGKGGIGQIGCIGIPVTAVETFQPYPWTFVKVGDGGGYFVLYNVFSQVRLVATRCLVPSLGTEIIAEFADIFSPSAMVATVDQVTVFVPLVYRNKEVFLAQ